MHGSLERMVRKVGLGTTFTVCFSEAQPEGTPDPQPLGCPPPKEDPQPPSGLRPGGPDTVAGTAGEQEVKANVSAEQELVLLVEDHDAVRSLVALVLRRQGYGVVAVRNGVEALEAHRQHTGPLHLLLADLFMPQMGGVELARELLRLRPGLKVLFTSGSLPPGMGLGLAGVKEPEFLQKPFRPEELLRVVRRTLDG